MDLGYWLYMNEAEGTGLVDTRLGKINAIGRELRRKGYRNSIVPANVFEELLNKGEITIEDYIEIERKIAFKYKMEESIFRMKKRACDYGSDVEKIER